MISFQMYGLTSLTNISQEQSTLWKRKVKQYSKIVKALYLSYKNVMLLILTWQKTETTALIHYSVQYFYNNDYENTHTHTHTLTYT